MKSQPEFFGYLIMLVFIDYGEPSLLGTCLDVNYTSNLHRHSISPNIKWSGLYIKNIKEINRDELQRLIKKYTLLKEFVLRISQEYNKYCCLLVHITDYLYTSKINEKPFLIDFYKKSYIMDI